MPTICQALNDQKVSSIDSVPKKDYIEVGETKNGQINITAGSETQSDI